MLHIILMGLVTAQCVCGQGTLLVDQASSLGPPSESDLFSIQSASPLGQSFTPSLSAIDYIQLGMGVGNRDGLGAAVYVNLMSTSFTGPIIGSTTPVVMPYGYGFQATTFYFPASVSVTPGTQYYFRIIVQSGGTWNTGPAGPYNYAGGTGYGLGVAVPNEDLWFQEGIVVPEPSAAWFALLGGGALVYARHKRRVTS